jgi:hypothetical protein
MSAIRHVRLKGRRATAYGREVRMMAVSVFPRNVSSLARALPAVDSVVHSSMPSMRRRSRSSSRAFATSG